MPTPPNAKKYWAFISCSSRDKKWGKWLHSRLENYPIPKEFRDITLFDGAVLGKNLRPIFLDRDELAGSAELGPAILKGLRRSRFLIVLCSPNSAQSKWVNKEIEDFKALDQKNHHRILALILDGEPNATSKPGTNHALECFPPALRLPVEPLAGDLRKEGDGKERGFLKFLAGISQIGFDDLYRRHERAKQRRRLIAVSTASILSCVFAVLISQAHSQRKIAESHEREARENRTWSQFHQGQGAEEKKHNLEAIAYYGAALSTDPSQIEIGIKALYILAGTSSYVFSDRESKNVEPISINHQVQDSKKYIVSIQERGPITERLVYTISHDEFSLDDPYEDDPEDLSPPSYHSINSFATASNSYHSVVIVSHGFTGEYGNGGGVIVSDSKHGTQQFDLGDYIDRVHISSNGNEFIACSGNRIHCFQRAAHEASPFALTWHQNWDDLVNWGDGCGPVFSGFSDIGDLVFEVIEYKTGEPQKQVVATRIGNSLYPERLRFFEAPHNTLSSDESVKFSSEESVNFVLNSDIGDLRSGRPLEVFQREPRELLWSFEPNNGISARGRLMSSDTFLLIDLSDGGAGLRGFQIHNPRLGFLYQAPIKASAGPFSLSEKKTRIYSRTGLYVDSPEFTQAIDLLGENTAPPAWLPILCYAVAGLKPDTTGKLLSIDQEERSLLLKNVVKHLEESRASNRWNQFGRWYLKNEFPESDRVSPYSMTSFSNYTNQPRYKIRVITP